MSQDQTAISDVPPLPSQEDEARRAYSRLRRRLLEGQWKQDLDRKCREFFPIGTVERLGVLDTSRNLFGTVTKQLAIQYDNPPRVSHPDSDVDDFATRVRLDGLWAIGARNARNTIGMREGLIRSDYTTERGELLYRAVPSDLVYAEASGDNPDEPNLVVEARLASLDLGDGKGERDQWTWDVLDIRDPQDPKYRVLLPSGRADIEDAKDITEQVLGGTFSGGDYPYLVEGEPVLPYSLFHAQRTGALWNPWENSEQVECTLHIGALWSFWGYLCRDAAYSQRWAIGVQLGGGAIRGSGKAARKEVHLDPTSIAMFTEEVPGGGRLGQFGASVDPERYQLAIDSYEQRCLAHSGLSPDDFQKSGGAAESGYAIALKRETVRRMQKASEAQFERADKQVLALSAALLNANEGGSLPESGYSIRYMAVPPTPTERQARVAEATSLLDVGLASPVDIVLAQHPGMERAEAFAHLDTVREERVEFASMDRLPDAAGDDLESKVSVSTGGEVKAADTALNGAQVTAATGIVERVAMGALPRDSGISMLSEFFNIPKPQAERIMGSVGRGFRPTLQE